MVLTGRLTVEEKADRPIGRQLQGHAPFDLRPVDILKGHSYANRDFGYGHREAAACGDLVINVLSGAASLEVLQAVGEEHLDGKTLIDVSNCMDFSQGFPPTLFVKDTDSLGEMLQREFPNVRVVKTLNATTVDLMVNPKLVGNGDHTVFLSGNDMKAKAQVTDLLRELGWHDILDLGDISTARGPEMMFAIAHAAMRALSPAPIAFKVVR